MTSSSLAGAGLLILWGSISPTEVDEPAFNDWWTNEHLPERLALPGFLHCHRFADPVTSPTAAPESKYLVWYELDDTKALVSPQYMEKLDNLTLRMARFMPLLATLQRCACRVHASRVRLEFTLSGARGGVVGASTANVNFTPPPDKDACLDGLAVRLMELFAHPAVLAFHVVEQDEETTRAGSQTKSYAGVSQSFQPLGVKCMVLVEFSESIVSLSGQQEALKSMGVDWAAAAGSTDVEGNIYGLICAVG
ncbi:hypothetical protein DFH08DRAFT_677672 [Mycena albidolilacea]|uniref:Uncharacterized protein n=1 Tax=Mycena albidolilacea TaxID=1033008 RepID=A0AAD7F6D5_9AGAR|nr:hypothetical protein DFH08DRAFT_677672 [Mycena albidolilacea]